MKELLRYLHYIVRIIWEKNSLLEDLIGAYMITITEIKISTYYFKTIIVEKWDNSRIFPKKDSTLILALVIFHANSKYWTFLQFL